MEQTEGFVFQNGIIWLKLALELVGAVIIGVGAVRAVIHLVRSVQTRSEPVFTAIRLDFARSLSLALEFQLAADILGTAFSPGWQEIGELAAIAAIRTALNFFLAREMKEEQAEIAGEQLPLQEPAVATT